MIRSLISAAILALIVAAQPLRAAERPNIVFFLSDDQRADFMGCAGHPILKTPTLDRLAKGGVRFTNTFVTTSICAASRASILTGLYERTHRFTFGTPPIRAEHTQGSYPALLKKAGYRTGFVGKFGVGVAGDQRAVMFDYFQPLSRSPYFKKQKDGSLRHVSEIAGDRAIEFLEGCSKDQPFCLSVSFNAPHAEDGDKKNHYPWPKAVDGLYDDVKIPPPAHASDELFEKQPEFLKKSLNRQRWFWRWDTPEKYQRNVRAYYRMISGIDHVMGRVLEAIKKQGFAENTVVIFSGDNGYYRGDRQFAGKWSHYEESLRVPLIVFDPRAAADHRGKLVEAMALNVDIPATILAYAGVAIPQDYQGANLSPWMKGQQPDSWRTDFFCEHLMNHRGIPKWEGVRGRRYVYARYFEQQPPYEFLHDLQVDPHQYQNFARGEKAAEYAKVLAEMRRRADELRDKYGGPYKPHPPRKRRRAGK